jgi:endogenous inhibitor of DNA gyrase (YacG/DUF329 family)
VSSIPPKSARSVACPACGKPALFAPANPWRRLLMQRCRVTDLGAWANEDYKIPAKEEDDPGPDSDAEKQTRLK